MRRKAKSLIWLGLAVTLGLLVSCVYHPIESKKKAEPDVIKIEFWYGLSGYLGELMKEIIDDFNQQQTGVQVIGVAQGSYEETAQALRAAIVRQKPPAAVLLEDQRMQFFANIGALSPLDSYIHADQDFHQEDFVDSFLSQGEFHGVTYALPMYGTTQVLYYRKDLFAQGGVDPEMLGTWEGLAEAAKKLTKVNGQEVLVYGWEPMQGPENLIDAAISRGGKFLSADGKTVTIDGPAWIEAWEFFRKAIHEAKVMKVNYGGNGWEYWYATIHDVMQGRAAGYTGSSGDQGDLDFNIIGAHIQPAWKGYEGYPRAVAHARAIGIPDIIPEEQKEAAFQWIKYITSTEVTARWSMQTGYLPVRESAMDTESYRKFTRDNPQIMIPYQQTKLATRMFFDPTGGKIYEALKVAAEKVEIHNIPAQTALKEAKEKSQRELDKVLAGGDSH
ncbi:ABC transporter substrate-binding protein [Candidatus Formimonas warabiya]|uniref:ABC transporter substrate-binding protein n=1 Tax=Formimonas warabiya TaxID=1761012 RepID=A0A3G1L155_FORW1|nr:ABC transporter substrate-binding protein [Candidatus Formimonas warabiya]ATW28374.1 ABC transporter substrate-binding protein [Candidatus Formimonas warabiya]